MEYSPTDKITPAPSTKLIQAGVNFDCAFGGARFKRLIGAVCLPEKRLGPMKPDYPLMLNICAAFDAPHATASGFVNLHAG
jgi:hypothetical protein